MYFNLIFLKDKVFGCVLKFSYTIIYDGYIIMYVQIGDRQKFHSPKPNHTRLTHF